MESSNNDVELWKTQSGLVPSLREELASMKSDLLNLEKELQNSQRDVNKFKETIEVSCMRKKIKPSDGCVLENRYSALVILITNSTVFQNF